MLKRIKIALVCAIVILVACQNERHQSSPVVAVAGRATLHLDELRSMMPDHQALLLSSVQVQNLVQRWAEEELVYQHALSEDFDKNPELEHKINELVKNYIVAIYLRDRVDNSIEITADEIQTYYNSASGEFIRAKDYYNVNVLVVETYAEANNLRRQILNGESFTALAAEHSLDASKQDGGQLGWVTQDQLPQDLARRVKIMTPNSISRPIKTVVGYYLVQVNGVRKKGQEQTLDEVSDIIRHRLRARKREERYRQLVNQLKENTTMTINWSFIDSLDVVK